jgi:hypothetical protein
LKNNLNKEFQHDEEFWANFNSVSNENSISACKTRQTEKLQSFQTVPSFTQTHKSQQGHTSEKGAGTILGQLSDWAHCNNNRRLPHLIARDYSVDLFQVCVFQSRKESRAKRGSEFVSSRERRQKFWPIKIGERWDGSISEWR